MRKKDIAIQIEKITGDIFGTVADVFLFQTFLVYTIAGKHTHYEIDKAFLNAQALLSEINHKTISQSLSTLIRKKLIKRMTKEGRMEIAITEEGKRRIYERIPTYKTTRPWDGYLYLVSYDIPNKHNNARNKLRLYLRRIGCALLQESLWVTPYNPHEIVEEFVNLHEIPGTILVSKLAKDGSIGDEDTQTMIARVYQLEELKNRYDAFIAHHTPSAHVSLSELAIDYYALLRDDPQLPFKLEPPDFSGTKAYTCFQSCIHKANVLL